MVKRVTADQVSSALQPTVRGNGARISVDLGETISLGSDGSLTVTAWIERA